MKKLLIIMLGTALLLGFYFSNASTYSPELEEAYERAYENGIIADSSIDDANLYDTLTNGELANIMAGYERYLGIVFDGEPVQSCRFDKEPSEEISNLCLMYGLGRIDERIVSFDDADTDTNRAIFGTAISRALRGDKYDGGIPYYKKHLEALKSAGIMNQIDNPEKRTETKGYVLNILKRSSENYNSSKISCDDPIVKVACTMGSDECPKECTTNSQCKGMDSAKVSHTINNDTITLKRDAIEGENVKISIYNPDNETYETLGTVKMNKKSFTYKIKREGEQNFKLSNGCNEYNYRINVVTTEEKTNKTISDFPGKITKISDKNILLKGKNAILGEFTIKPENNKTINLTNIKLRDRNDFSCNDISLIIENDIINDCDKTTGELIYKMNKTVNSEGVSVKIIQNKAELGTYMIGLLSINDYYNYEEGLAIPFEFFTKRYEDTIVYIKKQLNKGKQTEYTLGIDKTDNSITVFNVGIFETSDCSGSPLNTEKQKSLGEGGTEYTQGQTMKVNNEESEKLIKSISYNKNNGEYICINKKEFPEYFKVNGIERKVYKQTDQESNSKEILNNGYTREMNNAYEFAHENGITTTKNIEKAKMNSPLTRIAMAKMLSYYATNVLGQKPDTTKTIKFNDVTDKQNSDYNNAVTLSYQLGIMGQNMKNNNFRPNDEVTRAEFATALSRMIYGTADGSPYYTTHLNKLKQEKIISNDNPKLKEKRGYVMIMLMRTTE